MKTKTYQVWCMSSLGDSSGEATHALSRPKNEKKTVNNKFLTYEEAIDFINQQTTYSSYVVLETHSTVL